MNLNGDYAAIFNNLLLGETPPVEVKFVGLCVSFLLRATAKQREPVVSRDQTSVLCSRAQPGSLHHG